MSTRRILLTTARAAAAAAVLLTALAATASATIVTSPPGTLYTSTIEAEDEGTLTFHHGIADVTCETSSFGTTVEQHGEAVAVKGKISSFNFGVCNHHVSVVTKGTLEIEDLESGDSTVNAPGLLITVQFTTGSGKVHCVFGGTSLHLGTLTDAPGESEHASLNLEATLPIAGGDAACGKEAAELTGGYEITTPTGLTVDDAFPSSTLTAPTGTKYTGEVNSSSKGKATFHHASGITINCNKSGLSAEIKQHGPGNVAGGPVTQLFFNECGQHHVKIVNAGTLLVHPSGSGNGTVTLDGTKFTVQLTTISGTFHCEYETSANTDIGTLTGTPLTAHAVLDIQATSIPRVGEEAWICGEEFELTGGLEYTISKPLGLSVDEA